MKPHVYKRDGCWWVLCKHRHRTGPYAAMWTAFGAASAIWREPSVWAS